MSYSNGKLPEDTFSHEKVIEIVKGLPGVGFKLTDDGDYDMQNKKLRNVDSPQTNDDATTKSYVDSEVNKTLKLDGSSAMTGALNMDNRRIENIAPARHGYSDAVSSLHLHNFYFDLNTNDGKIEAQNPIDMKNQKITNLANPSLNNNDAMSYKFYTDNFVKPGYNGDIDCNNKRFYNVGSVTNEDQLTTTQEANTRFLRKDGVNHMTTNLKMNQNKIINMASPSDPQDGVNKRYLESHTGDMSDYLKRDGSISVTSDFDFGDNKITQVGNGTQLTDLVNKGYIDTELASKPNINQVVLRDGSQYMTGNLNMNQKKNNTC